MPHGHDKPYAAEHRRALEFLDGLTPTENDALLRRAGILDATGHLAEKYKAGGEPVSGEVSAAAKGRR